MENSNKNTENQELEPLETEMEGLDSNDKEEKTSLIVVGVGASAGGLEALQFMVANLPPESGMSFILAQHLSPSYKSMMVDLLAKDATIPVVAAKNNEALQPNVFYVCPPSYNIEITKQDVIVLSLSGENRHIPRPSVDMLFESLAFAKGESSIGVVLSGTGSDGSRGVRAIKGEGGFAIAQDPNTAKYDGMPNSAINSGTIDMILPPEEIGPELKNVSSYPRSQPLGMETKIASNHYYEILRVLKRRFKVDFSLYKESTIMRRIERRLMALKINKAKDYVKYLSNHDDEVEFLFNDMLIGVTAFFRDTRAFNRLQDQLKQYLNNKDNKVIRIWSTGCSTGEEAYSLAIVLTEILGRKIDDWKIQIFATDIDKRAVSFARSGVYPESALHNLPETIRHKYFTVNGEQFEVIKPIKALVIFSVHNLVIDPPFLRLDLVVCRNLLIYFNLELQRQILPVFHYALNPKGLMFLGQSESIGVFQENFKVIAKSEKIYEANFIGKKEPPDRHLSRTSINDFVEDMPAPQKTTVSAATKAVSSLSDVVTQNIKKHLLPYVIIVNDNMDIVYTVGKNPLLVRPEGLPSNNVFQNLHSALSIDLRSAIHILDSGQATVSTAFQKIEIEEEIKWARLVLMDAENQPGMGRLILIFCQVEDVLDLPIGPVAEGTNDTIIGEQERQLLKTKEQLQTVIEELETSNEEMQSMNEELQSSNEELQSSNEELETTNEELQSTNEELQTAYSELRVAYEDKDQQQIELEKVQKDLQSANALLEDAERMGKTGSLRWNIPENRMDWSKGIYKLFDIHSEAIPPTYQALVNLVHEDDRASFTSNIDKLLHGQGKTPFSFRTRVDAGHIAWLRLDVAVSFNELKQAQFFMGTLTDTSEVIISQNLIEERDTMVNALLNAKLSGVYIYSFDESLNTFINGAYTSILGYELSELQSMNEATFIDLFHPDDLEKVQQHMKEVYEGELGETHLVRYRFKSKQGEYVSLYSKDTVYQMNPVTGKPKSMIGVFMEFHENDNELQLTVPKPDDE